MKKLFVLVSVIAVLYLAMQTSYMKSALVSMANYISPNSQTQLQYIQSLEKDNASLIAQLTTMSAQNTVLSDTQNLLAERVTLLEAKIENVTVVSNNHVSDEVQSKNGKSEPSAKRHLTPQEPEGNMAWVSSNQSDERLDHINSPSPLNQTVHKAMYGQSETDSSGKAVRISTQSAPETATQAQKRLQQQAILRELAQKMELAALSSLSN